MYDLLSSSSESDSSSDFDFSDVARSARLVSGRKATEKRKFSDDSWPPATPRKRQYEPLSNSSARSARLVSGRKATKKRKFRDVSRPPVTPQPSLDGGNSNSTFSALDEQRWLDDETINSYLSLVQKKTSRMWIASTHFKPKLEAALKFEETYRWVKNNRGKTSIFNLDYLLIPLHISASHWSCAIVHMNSSPIRMQYYDSFDGAIPQRFFKKLRQWIQSQNQDVEIDKVEIVKDGPKQSNSYDCGVFVSQFIKYFVLKNGRLAHKNTFTEQDMPSFRQQMKRELEGEELEDLE